MFELLYSYYLIRVLSKKMLETTVWVSMGYCLCVALPSALVPLSMFCSPAAAGCRNTLSKGKTGHPRAGRSSILAVTRASTGQKAAAAAKEEPG